MYFQVVQVKKKFTYLRPFFIFISSFSCFEVVISQFWVLLLLLVVVESLLVLLYILNSFTTTTLFIDMQSKSDNRNL